MRQLKAANRNIPVPECGDIFVKAFWQKTENSYIASNMDSEPARANQDRRLKSTVDHIFTSRSDLGSPWYTDKEKTATNRLPFFLKGWN